MLIGEVEAFKVEVPNKRGAVNTVGGAGVGGGATDHDRLLLLARTNLPSCSGIVTVTELAEAEGFTIAE